MKKLFNLKEWLTLEDTAKRLSFSCDEEVTTKDVLQLAHDGRLKLSWYLRHRPLEEVALKSSLIGNWFLPENKLPEQPDQGPLEMGLWFRLYGKKAISLDYERLSDPKYADGVYRLCLDTGMLDDWLISLITGHQSKLINLEGFLVETKDGTPMRPVDLLPPKENEKYYDRMALRAYPTDYLPEFSELVILREDLEAFERELLPPPATSSLRTQESSLTEALGIMSILLAKKRSDLAISGRPNAKQISEAVQKEAAKLGIDATGLSNLNRDISQAVNTISKKFPS